VLISDNGLPQLRCPGIPCLLFVLEMEFGVGLETWLSINHH